MSAVIVVGVHYKWGYAQPLLMSGLMQLKQLYENKAIQIHLLNNVDITRPYAAAKNPFEQWADKQKAAATATQEVEDKKTE